MENQNTVRYDRSLVEAAQLPQETQDLLLLSGLPQFHMNQEALLGIHFEAKMDQGLIHTKDGRKTMFPIGYEWDETTALLGLEAHTGSLYTLNVHTGEYGVINSSLSLFLTFLQRYAVFVNEYSRSYEPSVMTLEQAQAKLAAFRRGEVTPPAQKNSPQARKQALKQLRLFYTDSDPVSVAKEDSRWSVVLEQLEDEIL
ncbi:SUKH-4 family immunity protein [Paenibacillus amylolyticus]|nr:SUKH-4 family immunity protein [Paenibacillus amylolyticus]WFR64227.1 SUKH-4 family immunity protein [Paenibacillus amylolyticus]